MSKCTISIDLDQDSVRLPAGGVVRGVVTVEVNADCKCKALSVTLFWQTHGRGNRTQDTVETVELFGGAWKAGERASYPFELPLPDGPVSYHGHYFNVDWYLQARADIPWAIDPKYDKDILLVPGPSMDPARYPTRFNRVPGVAARRNQGKFGISFGALIFSLPFLGVGLFVLLLGLVSWGGGGDGLLMVLFGLGFFVAGLVIFYSAIRNKLASMKLGKIRIDWPEGFLSPGDTAPLVVDFKPVEGFNGLSARLVCRETVVSGSGTNKRTYYGNVFDQPIPLALSTVSANQRRAEGVIELSKRAPPSFYARSNELSWYIALHFDVARWPDWTRELYLDVRPRRAAAALDAPAAERDGLADAAQEAFVEAGIEDTEAW